MHLHVHVRKGISDLSIIQNQHYIYTALFFSIVPFQIHTLVPSNSTSWSSDQLPIAALSSSSPSARRYFLAWQTGQVQKVRMGGGRSSQPNFTRAKLPSQLSGLDWRVVLVKQNPFPQAEKRERGGRLKTFLIFPRSCLESNYRMTTNWLNAFILAVLETAKRE